MPGQGGHSRCGEKWSGSTCILQGKLAELADGLSVERKGREVSTPGSLA